MKRSKTALRLAVPALILGVALPAAFAQGIGENTLRDLMIQTPRKLERGKVVWNDNCATCHGATGAGDGAQAQYFPAGLPNLSAAEYRNGGGLVQINDAISRGENGHPLFEHLPYQDLWAVTHYARSLGGEAAAAFVDPPEVVTRALFEAREGVCNPAVKAGIDDKMKFLGETQITQGMAVYTNNCASCHGAEGKGDGSAAGSLNPVPRDFTAGDGWTNGTSPLAIFNTLAVGIEGTSMAGFKHLPEAERWALTHLIREKWVPKAAQKNATPEEVEAVCRALSGGSTLAALPIEDAMKKLVDDLDENRTIRMAKYGTAWVEAGANAKHGQEVYEKHCQSCHGPVGVGTTLGPYGSQPPYLVVKVNKLEPGLAGGTYRDFAARSIGGAHIAIPDVTGASHVSEGSWKSLHAYVTSFQGAGTVRPAAERPVETAQVEDETAPTAAQPKPAAQPAANPAAQPAAKPAAKPAATPAAAQPAAKPAAPKADGEAANE